MENTRFDLPYSVGITSLLAITTFFAFICFCEEVKSGVKIFWLQWILDEKTIKKKLISIQKKASLENGNIELQFRRRF